MKYSAILVLSFAFVAVNAINRKFDTSGGSTCTWSDRSYNGGEKSIFFECTCVGQSGKALDYSCEYYGNPSHCELFDKPGGTERFWHHVSDNMKSKKILQTPSGI